MVAGLQGKPYAELPGVENVIVREFKLELPQNDPRNELIKIEDDEVRVPPQFCVAPHPRAGIRLAAWQERCCAGVRGVDADRWLV